TVITVPLVSTRSAGGVCDRRAPANASSSPRSRRRGGAFGMGALYWPVCVRSRPAPPRRPGRLVPGRRRRRAPVLADARQGRTAGDAGRREVPARRLRPRALLAVRRG